MRPSFIPNNCARISALLVVALVYFMLSRYFFPGNTSVLNGVTIPDSAKKGKLILEKHNAHLYNMRCDESKSNFRADGSISEECTKVNRLIEYCVGSSSNHHKAIVLPRNAEGATFHGHEKYSLRHVLATIRHGDRTSIHKMPGSRDGSSHQGRADEPEGSGQHFLDSRVQKHLLSLQGYTVLPIYKLKGGERIQLSEAEQSRVRNLTASIDKDAAFSVYDSELLPGQLTSLGYMQHVDLGRALHVPYSALVSQMTSGRDIYVRSTNYERTVQSVAALLSQLVPGISGPEHRLYIRTHPDEKDEIMHGAGIRLSSHHVTASGEATLEGTCSAATSLGKKQRGGFKTKESVLAGAAEVFGETAVRGRPVSDLVDAAITRVCHSEPLPCSSSQPGTCVGEELLGDLMAEADRLFCERYNGSDGGRRSTLLATFPLMSEIYLRLHEATRFTNGTKMTILSGHDTVIGPVLASLDIYKNGCKWPPYASRIIFELWQRKSEGVQMQSAQKEEYFVRVIYNGKDVTHEIPYCTKAAGGSPLCPLAAFKAQIDAMLGGAPSLDEACSREV